MNRLGLRLATLVLALGLAGCGGEASYTGNAPNGLTPEQDKNLKDLAAKEDQQAKTIQKETSKKQVLGP